MSGFMLSDDSLTVQFSNLEVKTIHAHSPHFGGIVQAIKDQKSEDEIRKLFNLAEAVKTFSEGLVTIRGSEVIYKDQVIKNSVADRILKFMSMGLPWKPLAKFLENLLQNPSKRAIDYLYNFLEYKKLAISEDGCFVAYKAVRNDYLDKHSGKFMNLPGTTLEMTRNEVCDDPSIGCSYGFHVGSLEYVRDFACGYGTEDGDRIVIVKVNPADVVSVPHDCNFQKVRTSKYQVMAEFTGELPEYVGSSCDALADMDSVDDEGDYEGVHVTVKCVNCDCDDNEHYIATSYTQAGFHAGSFETDNIEDTELLDFVGNAKAANLQIRVLDQNNVDVTDSVLEQIN